MKLPRTNIEHQLQKVRSKSFDPSSWKHQVSQILKKDEQHEESILKNIEGSAGNSDNSFEIDLLASDRIYHISQIKQICIDYRLRFLDAKFFKGKLPYEAISKIKALEKEHNTTLKGYKIIAPSKLFKLENADDPLLFAPLGNDYFYLIHKWGNDLHPLRKIAMWFFKSFENLAFLTFLISLFLTLLIPNGLFTHENSTSTFFMLFLFMFKSVAAIVIFYGFALGKNFNTAIWNSKYFNA